jgi:hypothetical protein
MSGRDTRKGRSLLTVRLRTLIVIVVAVAGGLGWWRHHLRRAAVDGLLALVPSGILLGGGPSSPYTDPTFPPDRARYAIALRQVRAHHGEALAESDLAATLGKARLSGDEASGCSASAMAL